MLKNQPVDEGLKKVFLKLPELFGSLEQMQERKAYRQSGAAGCH